jgi:Phospholipase_D-nuclease N-terminal
MFLVGALFALVTIGLVVPCLIDVAVAQDHEVRGLAKPWWVLILVFLPVLGVAAWLLFGRPWRHGRARPHRSYPDYPPYLGPEDALRRHPAGQATERGFDVAPGRAVRAGAVSARPVGPDDDPEFLEELARRIRGGEQAGNDA